MLMKTEVCGTSAYLSQYPYPLPIFLLIFFVLTSEFVTANPTQLAFLLVLTQTNKDVCASE